MTDPRPLRAALTVLIALQAIMLANLYAGVPPHPPVRVAPFAISPFLAVAIAVALIGWQMAEIRAGAGFALLAGVLALVSFGPQKYLDAAFPQIWPAVITAQLAILATVILTVPSLRKGAPQ